MIGKQLSPILVEIENTLWEFESRNYGSPEFTQDGFRAVCKIFISVIMDKIWDLQENESMTIEDRLNMAQKCGEDFAKLIKIYTNIDSTKLYSNDTKATRETL